MYPTKAARELGILLRISRELDVVGDVTAIVDNPSELLAWATTLTDPSVTAWIASGSGSRYVQVSAIHSHEPIRGEVTAVLRCDQHVDFWRELTSAHKLKAGEKEHLAPGELSRAWQAMPITPPT
ncbi:MAG: hypothetical protein WA880_11045 [Ornithinimicrobium sp.]